MSTKIRAEKHYLAASERPHAMYGYYVTGRGQFPFDMLRHDACWPADGEGAAIVEESTDGFSHRGRVRSIKMHSYKEPTIDRWSSFLWSVGLEKMD